VVLSMYKVHSSSLPRRAHLTVTDQPLMGWGQALSALGLDVPMGCYMAFVNILFAAATRIISLPPSLFLLLTLAWMRHLAQPSKALFTRP